MSSIAQKSDISGALWLNLKFENIFEKKSKIFKKMLKIEKFSIFFENIFKLQIEPQGARSVQFSIYGAHSTENCPNFLNLTQTWVAKVSAHMWHTEGTSYEKCDFCACCVHIIMCLVCAYVWGCAPTWSSASGGSNAVSRSKMRHKLVPVAPCKVCLLKVEFCAYTQ